LPTTAPLRAGPCLALRACPLVADGIRVELHCLWASCLIDRQLLPVPLATRNSRKAFNCSTGQGTVKLAVREPSPKATLWGCPPRFSDPVPLRREERSACRREKTVT